MKVTRKMLLIIIAAMGAFIILYGLFRQLTGLSLGEAGDKRMMDIIMITALGLFIYNRKLAKDERNAREAAEQAESQAADKPEEEVLPEDDDLPH